MAREATFAAMGRQGLLPLEPDAGMRLLMNCIAHPPDPVVTACPMDVARLPGTPYYRLLCHASGRARTAHDSRASHVASGELTWLVKLREMKPLERREAIRSRVALVVTGVGIEGLEGTTVWGEVGLDSLGMVEVRNGVVRAFENVVPLGATALFDYPTLNALVEHLEATLCPQLDAGGSFREHPSTVALHSSAGKVVGVVGMSCRFPGGGNGPEAFWRMLVAGVDGAMEIPVTRMDWRSLYVPDGAPGLLYTNRAALLDVGLFIIFRISPWNDF